MQLWFRLRRSAPGVATIAAALPQLLADVGRLNMSKLCLIKCKHAQRPTCSIVHLM